MASVEELRLRRRKAAEEFERVNRERSERRRKEAIREDIRRINQAKQKAFFEARVPKPFGGAGKAVGSGLQTMGRGAKVLGRGFLNFSSNVAESMEPPRTSRQPPRTSKRRGSKKKKSKRGPRDSDVFFGVNDVFR